MVHLHGELDKVRAIDDESLVWKLDKAHCETSPETVIEGHHVRPHIVFFQEAVPNFEPAVKLVQEADIFVIIGTSLAVYPAASLLHYVRAGVPVYYIDPRPATVPEGVYVIAQGASQGLETLTGILTGQRTEAVGRGQRARRL